MISAHVLFFVFVLFFLTTVVISYLESDVGVFVHAEYLGFVDDGEGLYVISVLL